MSAGLSPLLPWGPPLPLLLGMVGVGGVVEREEMGSLRAREEGLLSDATGTCAISEPSGMSEISTLRKLSSLSLAKKPHLWSRAVPLD